MAAGRLGNISNARAGFWSSNILEVKKRGGCHEQALTDTEIILHD